MAPFEPSTWAEVSEALANVRAASQQPLFVAQVRAFTHAPHRYLAQRVPCERDDVAPSSPRLRAAAAAHAAAVDTLFDDVLGLGRVDALDGSLARRQLVAKPLLPTACEPSVINPSSSLFSAERYLAAVHAQSNRAQLRQGKLALAQLERRLHAQKDKYREHNFVFATYVHAHFELAKQSTAHLSPFDTQLSAVRCRSRFLRAENTLRSRYDDLLQRETKLERLHAALAVYRRYQWLFSLGNTLRSAANHSVTTIEHALTEYSNATLWLAAQPSQSLQLLRDDIHSGFQLLLEHIVHRLSNVHTSSADTSRLVAALFSVNHEQQLSAILSRRMHTAENALNTAIAAAELPTLLSDDTQTDTELNDLVKRASDGLCVALAQVWSLGRLLSEHERWMRVVESHVVRLCDMYAQLVREDVMHDVSLITTPIVNQVSSTRSRAVDELRIPPRFVAILEKVSNSVTAALLESLTRAVRHGTEKLAAYEVQRNTVGASSAKFLRAVIVEAMVQVEPSWVRAKEPHDDIVVITEDIDNEEAQYGRTGDEAPSVDRLCRTCAQAPLLFVSVVERMMTDYKHNHAAALRLAVCCTEMVEHVLKAVERNSGLNSPYNSRATQKQLQHVARQIGGIKDRALKAYVALVFEPLHNMASALVKEPDDKLDDSVSRTVPIKIGGISSAARELVLRLALVMVTTGKRTSNPTLLGGIVIKLIAGIGQTMIKTLGMDKLAYNRAAQLWVDVMFIQGMVTKGASADTSGLQSSLDGFSRVKERAVQAVLADGFSFSLTDMNTLRQEVVESELQECSMIGECFKETWGTVACKSDED
eukprot:TRINITY_DN444_c2_g1_i1.p2 TRINITY_DN444_c2_g1~~TRINITY_DN444_c2_g1_i1.p2  ORF type:complete len:819 (-),score=184.29 TRINITY_DN444_c2_g1_i1:20217-22673(-)